jgi:hypothetical protein
MAQAMIEDDTHHVANLRAGRNRMPANSSQLSTGKVFTLS